MHRNAARLRRLGRALLPAALLVAGLWLLHALGLALPFLIGAALFALVITWMLPSTGVRALDRLAMLWREWIWRHEEGRHHEFGGVTLHLEDDGRQVWLAGDDLQRVLRQREPDDALAARHSERWRRDAEGRLWLRLDAVVERLSAMPGRSDPRVQKLRRYFEREVLFPAAQRHRRSR